MKRLILSILFSPLFIIHGQTLDSLMQHISPFAGFDGRNARIKNHPVWIGGERAGIEVNKKYDLGVAYYHLRSKVYESKVIDGETKSVRIFYHVGGIFAGIILIDKYKWQMGSSIFTGLGTTGYKKTDIDKGFVFSIEPSLTLSYRIRDWIGLSATGGYTKMLFPQQLNTSGFSTPFINFGTRIYFKDLIQSLKNISGIQS